MYGRYRRRYGTYRRRPYYRKRVTRGVRRGWWRRKLIRRPRRFFSNQLPYSQLVKLRFQEHYAIAPGTPNYVRTWRGNGVYDPENGLGGGSCSSFSTYAEQYYYYTVLACKCFVKGQNTTTDHSIMFGLTARNEDEPVASAVADMRNSAETKRAHWKTCSIYRNGANTPVVYLKKYVKTKQIIPWAQSDRSNLSATTSSVPDYEWFFDLMVCHAESSASDTVNVTGIAEVHLTYYVKFSGPKINQNIID